MTQASTPDYSAIELMSLGQFKALQADWLKHLPTDIPKGFAQYLIDKGEVGPAVQKALASAFSSWTYLSSRLDKTDTTRHIPATEAGTVGEWMKGQIHHCVWESDLKALDSARFLKPDRVFSSTERKEIHFYYVEKVPPDMERVVACLGGLKKLRGAAVNPVQVLKQAWHPGPAWWPRYERDQSVQLIFLGVCGKDEFAFMRLLWHDQRFNSGIGHWSIKEVVVKKDHTFTPGEVLAFAERIGY